MSHVRLVNVTKKFGDVTAVNSLNLEIGKGECFSMLGPSGCGKTTTLRMVAGFEDLSEGEVYVGDRLISSPARNYYLPPEKRNFGMVFQAFAVWPHLSVYENVAFPLQIRNFAAAEIEKRTNDALRSTNLLKVASNSPADLSGGGKQRVALARRSRSIRMSCCWTNHSPASIRICGKKCASRSRTCNENTAFRSFM